MRFYSSLVSLARVVPVVYLALVMASCPHGYGLPTDVPLGEPANRVLQQGADAGLDISSNAAGASSEGETTSESLMKGGAPGEIEYSFKVPPMAGFQQLAGGKPIKEMLKRLITADVPVMYQTMMMVENGAATGFIGSMNTVGSLLSNTIQASQLQMDIFDATDHEGKARFQYFRDAYKSLTEEGPNKNIWPAALYVASGDRLNKDKTPAPFETFKPNESSTGSGPNNLVGVGTGAGAGTSGPAAGSSSSGSGSGSRSARLSEALFSRENNDMSNVSPEIVDDLKKAMLDWVGDLEWSSEATSDHSDLTKATVLQAKSVDIMGPPAPGVNNAFEKLRYDTKEQIWEHFNKVMKAYCEFKKENPNLESPIFEKKRPAEYIKEQAEESWKIIHSLDIKPSINLIDQLFKLFVSRRNIAEVNCESFRGTREDMPELDKESGEERGTGDGNATFDSCERSPKTCLRNVVMFRITMFIVESQVNHYYRWLFERLYGFTHNNPHLEVNLAEVFCKNLDLDIPCEPGHEFSTRIEENRLRWVQFANKLSRFAQGQGGSSVFRPSSDNSPLGAAGAASAAGSGAGGGS